MPIQSAPFPLLPRDTARAAEAAFGKGNIYLIIGDHIECLFAGVDLSYLALVTAFQYAENLPDRRAAEAVRTRTDWKYALHLPLQGPVFDHAALCRFRQQLLDDPLARQAFQQILDRLARIGLLRSMDDQRAEALGVLNSVCLASRLERLADAMRIALEALATRHSEWLRTVTLPYWYERYNPIASTSLLPHSQKEQQDLAQAIGDDAWHLLSTAGSDAALALVPEMHSLMHEWQRQFDQSAGQVIWRSPACAECAEEDGSSNGKAPPM